ncbi:MAG TPA: hypothetical protein VFW25_01580 [Silvibacterium sp.]|nr:hypothetical protein [Silvibacterium sp.]
MHPRTAAIKISALGMTILLGVCLSQAAYGDSSYQSSTQITGGTLVDSLRSIPFMGKTMKKMFEPVSTTTLVSGNRKAVVGADSIDIVDLEKEEMIHIDTVKKTYSVVTFAQMRQAVQQIPQRIEEAQQQAQEEHSQPAQQPKPNLKTSFSVDVKNTGAQKEVNGLMAQEQIVTLTMTVTDLDAPASGGSGGTNAQPNSMSYVLTTDAWIAPDPPQVKEIADFDARLGQKMMEGVDAEAWLGQMRSSNAGVAQLLGSKPGASDAMAQMAKEVAKLKGTRVLEVMSMGGVVPVGSGGPDQGSAQRSPQGQTNSAGSTAGQVAGDTAAQTATDESSRRMGSFGSALGGSMMSAWHRKKAKPAPADSDASTAPPAPGNGSSGSAPAGAANGSVAGTQNVVLMSMTTQKSNFSSGAVPESSFEVPAGYTQVASPMAAIANRQ